MGNNTNNIDSDSKREIGRVRMAEKEMKGLHLSSRGNSHDAIKRGLGRARRTMMPGSHLCKETQISIKEIQTYTHVILVPATYGKRA